MANTLTRQNNNRLPTILSCIIMGSFGMVLAIISPLLTEISRDFSLGIAQSGMLFTISFTGFMAFIFVGGILADRYSKKIVVSLSLFGYTAVLFLFAASGSFFVACIAIFMMGGFGGIIESQISGLVADMNPENPGYYINLSQIFLCLGALAGPLLGGMTVSGGLGWRGAYYILSGFILVMALLFITVKIPKLKVVDRVNIHFIKSILSDKKFLLICLCLIFYTGTEVGVWGWLSTFLKTTMNFSISDSAWSVGIFWVSMLIGRMICGRLSLKYDIKYIIIVLALLSGMATILAGLVKSGLLVWFVTGTIGLCYSSIYPFLVSMGGRIKSNATAFSLLVGSGSAGSIVVPFLMGIVAEEVNMSFAMLSPAILLFLIVPAILLVNKRSTAEMPAEMPH